MHPNYDMQKILATETPKEAALIMRICIGSINARALFNDCRLCRIGLGVLAPT
jgi:hypothetical protein